ncbi:hypothetical protein GCM10029976_014840 [Kribbella albertanoniae]
MGETGNARIAGRLWENRVRDSTVRIPGPVGPGIEDGAPRHDRKEKTMVENTAREDWIAPDFAEFETPTEVTGYAGRVN